MYIYMSTINVQRFESHIPASDTFAKFYSKIISIIIYIIKYMLIYIIVLYVINDHCPMESSFHNILQYRYDDAYI